MRDVLGPLLHSPQGGALSDATLSHSCLCLMWIYGVKPTYFSWWYNVKENLNYPEVSIAFKTINSTVCVALLNSTLHQGPIKLTFQWSVWPMTSYVKTTQSLWQHTRSNTQLGKKRGTHSSSKTRTLRCSSSVCCQLKTSAAQSESEAPTASLLQCLLTSGLN